MNADIEKHGDAHDKGGDLPRTLVYLVEMHGCISNGADNRAEEY
jgi:hypothetical protein